MKEFFISEWFKFYHIKKSEKETNDLKILLLKKNLKILKKCSGHGSASK